MVKRLSGTRLKFPQKDGEAPGFCFLLTAFTLERLICSVCPFSRTWNLLCSRLTFILPGNDRLEQTPSLQPTMGAEPLKS